MNNLSLSVGAAGPRSALAAIDLEGAESIAAKAAPTIDDSCRDTRTAYPTVQKAAIFLQGSLAGFANPRARSPVID